MVYFRCKAEELDSLNQNKSTRAPTFSGSEALHAGTFPLAFMARLPKIDGGFVALGREMLRSEEWRTLSCSAQRLYIALKAEFKGASLTVILPYSKIGLAAATASRAIKELEANGWIKVEHGGLENPNEYTFTKRHDRLFAFNKKQRGAW